MFSRGSRASGRHARDERGKHGRSLAEELGVADEFAPDPTPQDPVEPAAAAPAGPYDISEAPAGVTRLDLGSLKIPSVPGVEVRVQANQEGLVQQVFLVHGDSALQLGAFAAPRSEQIWDEVREDIRKSLFADGVAAEEAPGEYGVELRARVRTPQGQLKDLRFVGVSGPRWLVRAVYNGPAAVDPASAGPLAESLRGVVVDRGEEARPVKEPLPLRLSTELASQVQNQRDGAAGPPAAPAAAGGRANGGPAQTNGRRPSAGGGNASSIPAGGGVPPASSLTPGGNGGTPTDGNAPPRRKPSPRPRRRG